jgi:hypothetical protein
LEVGAEGGFKLHLRQDRDPGKQKLKGAVRTETYSAIIANKDHTTCGKERFIGTRPQGHHSFRVQSEVAWLKMGSGLYRRGQAMREGESLWSLIICNHQMEQVNMPG